MGDIIAFALIVIIVALVIFYIVKQKKKGAKCIGCPYANCPSKNKGNCSCNLRND